MLPSSTSIQRQPAENSNTATSMLSPVADRDEGDGAWYIR